MLLRICLFALILITLRLQHARAEDVCKALPSYLILNLKPEELKDKFTIRPSSRYDEVLNLYKDIQSKVSNTDDSARITSLCNQYFDGKQKPELNREFLVLPRVEITTVYQATMEKIPPITFPQPSQMGFNPANAHCDKPRPQGPLNCGEVDPKTMGLPQNFVELEKIYSWRSEGHADRFSQESCYCLQKKTPKEKIDKIALEASKKSLNELILKNSATNILNDYSAQFENVNFYLTNYPNVLKDGRSDVGQQAQLLCNDPAIVEEVVNERCKDYGTSPNLKEERLKALFDSRGALAGTPTIKQYMQALDSEIFNVVKAGTGKQSLIGSTMLTMALSINNNLTTKEKNLTRRNYDQVRFMYVHSQPEAAFIDTMLKHVMNDPTLEDLMTDKIHDGKLPPHLALKGLFEQNSNSPAMIKVLEKSKEDLKLVPMFHKAPKILDDFFDRLKTPKEFEKVLTRGQNAHPGLKMILSSKDLFNEIDRVRKNGGSFLSSMENDKEALIDHLDFECKTIHSKIADFVCTEEDKIIGKTNRYELKEIIATAENSLGEPDMIDLAVCSETDQKIRNGAFSNLDLSMRPIISDYTQRRKTKNPDELPVVMTLKNLENNKELQNYTAEAATSLIDPSTLYSMSDLTTPGGGGFRHLASDRNFSIGDGSIDQLSSYRKYSSSTGSGSGPVSETSTTPISRTEEVSPVNQPENLTQSLQQNIQNQFPAGMQSQLQNYVPAPAIQSPQVSRDIASEEEGDTPPSSQPSAPQNLSPVKQELMDFLGPRSQNKEIKEHFSAISDKNASELARLREEREADKKTISDLQLAAEKKESERLRKEYEDLDNKYQTLLKGQSSGQISGNGSMSGIDKVGGSTLNPDGEESAVADNGTQGVVPGQANFNPSKTGQNVISDPRISKMGNEKGAITVDLRQNEGKDREEEVYKILESTEDSKILEEIQKSGMTYMYKVVEGNQVKEIVETIAFKNLSPKLQELVLKKLEKKQQISLVELQLKEAKRKHAAQALRLELLLLDHQAKRRTH